MPPRTNTQYITSLATRQAASHAASYLLNPRNREDLWYPVYQGVFSDLVAFDTTGSLHLGENCAISLSSAELDVLAGIRPPPESIIIAPVAPAGPSRATEGSAAQTSSRSSKPGQNDATVSSTPESLRRSKRKPAIPAISAHEAQAIEAERQRHARLLRERYDEHQRRIEQAARAGDATEADGDTSMITLPDQNAQNRVPDFAVSHVHSVPLERPGDDEAEELIAWQMCMGLHTRHQCYPLVGEIKPLPSRHVDSTQRTADILKNLRHAERDLYGYCICTLGRDLSAQSLIAVSAAGIFWRWRVVTRFHQKVCKEELVYSRHRGIGR
ncbi:hypothetical protein PsYK624_102520 [Phanerochaete sordida]|uniref:Uncharacterized protein n=1 Tax=Phanerochaete sordida TaxID=48140 RepID=A0A9P3GI89_9APHY|nr:hypothetical protein PsYK624_102520 [Phanerochaete sordida]